METNQKFYLFTPKWKSAIAVIFIVSLTFLDGIIPPAGIPIAVLFIFLFFWKRKVPVKELGIFKPESWGKTILIGIGAAILIQVFHIFIVDNLLEWLNLTSDVPELYDSIEGNNKMLITFLIVSWTTAGFGEELIFRTFFIRQFSQLFNSEKYGFIISLIISSIIFGLLHSHNGLEAIISTGITGFILGLIYLYTRRNIWTIYIIHGTMNTIAFLMIYTGFYKTLM